MDAANYQMENVAGIKLLQDLPLSYNFCRNPDGRTQGSAQKGGSNRIWCITTNPNVYWDYCQPLRIFPNPPLCLSRNVSNIIWMTGVDLEFDINVAPDFVDPYTYVKEENLKCEDVHPDFKG